MKKKGGQPVTFLGVGTEFEGSLAFRGTILINGNFKGDINAKGNLIVGEEGMVEADIHVSCVEVRGEVHGNIFADQRVDVLSPGKVFGNIQAPAIVIDDGVIFEGQTRMYQARALDFDEGEAVPPEDYETNPPPGMTAIYGVVTDESTGNPLRNVEIRGKGKTKKTTRSNAAGYYELVNLGNGRWKLNAAVKGYKKAESQVEISDNGPHKQDFQLSPKKGANRPAPANRKPDSPG